MTKFDDQWNWFDIFKKEEKDEEKEVVNQMNKERAICLIRDTFNMIVGASYTDSIVKQKMISLIHDDCKNVQDIIQGITEWNKRDRHDNDLEHFLNWYLVLRPEEKVKAESEKTGSKNEKRLRQELIETQKALRSSKEKLSAKERELSEQEKKWQEENRTIASNMSALSGAITKMIADAKTDEIEKIVVSGLKKRIDDYIFQQYGKIEKKVNVVTEYGQHEISGIMHKQFETVLKFVSNNEPVFLVGPAGSGKNVICKQVADAMGLDFYFSNAVTQEYKITGFTDANGHFHESQFYKAFTNGGLFMLDEMDASIPEVLIILNAAIANRYFDFPAPIGKVEAHENFRVVAAGNTFGYGADNSYVGRNTLDAASLDRFAMVAVDYDEDIEMSVTNSNTELMNFCKVFRREAQEAGINIVVSYRTMSRMAKMDGLINEEDLISSCLVKGLEKDDLHIIVENLSRFHNKYMDALKSLEARSA